MVGDRCIACGYAKLPHSTAAAQLYETVTIVVRRNPAADVAGG